MITRWEEDNRQRGENLINDEPGVPETTPHSKFNIVIQEGKKTEADFGSIEQPISIKPTSPKHSYDFDKQKYYKEVAKTFNKLTLSSEPQGEKLGFSKARSPDLSQPSP